MTRALRLFVTAFFFLPAGLQAASFDHSTYDKILRTYVNNEGLVNYDGIRQNAKADLKTYLDTLAAANPSGWPYAEKFAFWINAYNANMLMNIVNNPQLKKVSDKFSLFDTPAKVAGGTYTLNDIENRIIRGKVKDK